MRQEWRRPGSDECVLAPEELHHRRGEAMPGRRHWTADDKVYSPHGAPEWVTAAGEAHRASGLLLEFWCGPSMDGGAVW